MTSRIILNTLPKFHKFMSGIKKAEGDDGLFQSCKSASFKPKSMIVDSLLDSNKLPTLKRGYTFYDKPNSNSSLMFGFLESATEISFGDYEAIRIYQNMCEPVNDTVVLVMNSDQEVEIQLLHLSGLQPEILQNLLRYRMDNRSRFKLHAYINMMKLMVVKNILSSLSDGFYGVALENNHMTRILVVTPERLETPAGWVGHAPAPKAYIEELGELAEFNQGDYFFACSKSEPADNTFSRCVRMMLTSTEATS